MKRAWMPVLAAALAGCPSTQPPLAAPRSKASTSTSTLRYELGVALDLEHHALSVGGRMESPRPVSFFFLNPGFDVMTLEADGKEVRFRRVEDRVEWDEPHTRLGFSYRGVFAVPSGRDFKSHAWIDASRIRLTEATVWYPVLPRAGSDAAWPPEPAVARITLPPVGGLTWITSGAQSGDGTYDVSQPSDLVVVAVPYARTEVAAAFPSGAAFAFDVYSARSELGSRLSPILGLHAARLGAPGERSHLSVVDFPTEPKNWLSFVSSGLVVFNATAVASLADGELRGFELGAHELAHLWFGVTLQPEGPALRWLLESFAEYYAWRAVFDSRGEEARQKYVAYATKESDGHPQRIDALGWGDELVYTRGALAVAALATAVGEGVLDAAIRDVVARRGAWSLATLFDALAKNHADASAVAAWRSTWGA